MQPRNITWPREERNTGQRSENHFSLSSGLKLSADVLDQIVTVRNKDRLYGTHITAGSSKGKVLGQAQGLGRDHVGNGPGRKLTAMWLSTFLQSLGALVTGFGFGVDTSGREVSCTPGAAGASSPP